MSGSPFAALTAGAAGLASSAAGWLAQTTGTVPDLSPWLTAGGQLTLTGAALYAFKMALEGRIVLRSVAEREREMAVMLAGMAEREERLQAALARAVERDRAYAKRLEENSQALWKAADIMERRSRPR